MIDIGVLVTSIVAVFVSIVSFILSHDAQKNGNRIAGAANEMLKGQVEMQIREMISSARRHYEEISFRASTDEDKEILKAIEESALENVLNAYDEACAKYIDYKVDRERFKKLYFEEIKQVVEDPSISDKYKEPQTKYHATNKVYTEWNNREK